MSTYMVNGNLSGLGVSFGTIIPAVPVTGSNIVGYLKGISLGGMSDLYGNGTSGIRHLQLGLGKNTTEGIPNTPSLELKLPNSMWRFRWTVKPGTRTVSIKTKQIDCGGLERPTMKIKANVLIGLNSDLTLTASSGNNWVTIGPLSFTATALGVTWVEVWNNLNKSNHSAYFDHIVIS